MVQCRSCLTKTATEYIDMKQSSLFGDSAFSYLEIFNEITNLGAITCDDLPATICTGCSHDLQVAFDFVQAARQADTILRENIATKLRGDEMEESQMERVEYVEGSVEEECVIEELLEDNTDGDNDGLSQLEETVEEHILDDSMDGPHYAEEKPPLEQLLVELTQSDSPLETLQIKEEQLNSPDFYSVDELDEEYLIEYHEDTLDASSLSKGNNDSFTKLAPSGSKWRCVECKRVLRGDVSYEGHMNMHKDLRPYKCVHCQCSFRCKFALERHIELRHPVKMTATRFFCDLCQKEFGLQMLLEEHQCEELETFHSCTKCTKTFESPIAVEEHQELVHSSATSSIQCPHCTLASLPRAEVAEHFRIEHPAEYLLNFHIENSKTTWQCEICKRCLSSEWALRDHRNTHLNERPHECQFCSKRFATTNNLRGHMRSHTQLYEKNVAEGGGETVVQCELCKKQLLRRNLDKHLAMHEKKDREANEGRLKFLCAFCPRECKNQKSLNQHEKMHAGESPDVIYVCADCERHYSTENLLMQHRKQAHKKKDNVCPICGNAFKLKNQLVNHMKLHLEKNIQCPQCDKKYARRFDLNVHLRTHTGELPFSCHLCEKRFAIKVRLTYHLQKHNGVKHRCKECSAEFNSKQKLKAHSYKHTGMPYRCDMCDDHGFANRDVFKRHLLRVHKATMTDDALVEMFQRNTGKTTRIRPINEHVVMPAGRIADCLINGEEDIAMEMEIENS